MANVVYQNNSPGIITSTWPTSYGPYLDTCWYGQLYTSQLSWNRNETDQPLPNDQTDQHFDLAVGEQFFGLTSADLALTFDMGYGKYLMGYFEPEDNYPSSDPREEAERALNFIATYRNQIKRNTVVIDHLKRAADLYQGNPVNTPPLAEAGPNKVVNRLESVTFDGSASSDPPGTMFEASPNGGEVVKYYWDFGDGGTDSGQVVNHTYMSSGIYTVTLTVEDNDGAVGMNRIEVRVKGEDTTAPAAIVNLAVSTGLNDGEVILTWTAPGNDGWIGRARDYQIKYSSSAILTELDWEVALETAYYDQPALANQTEKLTLSRLPEGSLLYFAVRAEDEAGRQSPLSNSPWAVVQGENQVPFINLLEPDGVDDVADTSYLITWQDRDADGNARISLYYDDDTDSSTGLQFIAMARSIFFHRDLYDTGLPGGMYLLPADLSEDDEIDAYLWDTSAVAEGDYYIYAEITDGNSSISDYSPGPVTIIHHVPFKIECRSPQAAGTEFEVSLIIGALENPVKNLFAVYLLS